MAEYFQYNDPLRIIWRAGTTNDPFTRKEDTLKIINNRVVLSEIPSKFHKVEITGFTEVIDEVYSKKGSLTTSEFVVNYSNGIVQFNQENENRTINATYRGRGIIQYPAERIYYHGKNDDVYLNLQDIIEDSLDKVSEAQTEINNIRQAIVDSKVATTLANIATDNANLATDNAREAYESTIMVYYPPVQRQQDLTITYPNPVHGARVMVQGTGDIYRFDENGGTGWEKIENWTEGAIPLASETANGLLFKGDYTTLKKRQLVFVLPETLNQGVQKVAISFPFNGKLLDAYAYCGIVGSTPVEISVEKISETEFANGGLWSTIFTQNMIFNPSSNKASSPIFLDENVNENDHFRVNVVTTNPEIKDVVIHLEIFV